MQDLEKAVRQYADSSSFREALCIPKKAEIFLSKLAQGECNVNFLLRRPGSGKNLVLRVNLISQMHLADQAGYEYAALSALSETGRTPKPLYLDSTARTGTGERIGNGLMVYEYLPGRPLNYRTDLSRAAALLADIHSCPYPKQASSHGNVSLIEAHEPLHMILEECTEMFKIYQNARIADPSVQMRIERMLDRGYAMLSDSRSDRRADSPAGASESSPKGDSESSDGSRWRCIINTELNSGNFLMNDGGRDYLIDWEKPLFGEPAQDLGHFLAPTTTFWKTDVLLTEEETEFFVKEYLRAAAGRFDTEGIEEALQTFIPITCLRGLTWSAMAWVQYQDPASSAPKNKDTWKKLCDYLSRDFLGMIEKRYFQ